MTTHSAALLASIVLFTISAPLGAGQTAGAQRGRASTPAARVRVYVMHTGSDATGVSLAHEMRQRIDGSARLALAGTLAEAALVAHVISVDAGCGNSNSSAAVAIVTNNRAQTLVTLRQVTMSVDRAGEMAERVLSEVQKPIDDWRASVR
jgi:hypothetical protein